jgi:hypothetical protein
MKLKGYIITASVVFASALLLTLWLAGYWDHIPPPKPLALPPLSPPQEPAPAPLPPAPASVEEPASQPSPEPVANNLPPPEPAPSASEEAAASEAAALQQQIAGQIKVVTNNLRELGAAGQQYMLDKGVTEASYTDLVGTDSDRYIRSIAPAADESYQDTVIYQATTQISVSSASFGTVTYNL